MEEGKGGGKWLVRTHGRESKEYLLDGEGTDPTGNHMRACQLGFVPEYQAFFLRVHIAREFTDEHSQGDTNKLQGYAVILPSPCSKW